MLLGCLAVHWTKKVIRAIPLVGVLTAPVLGEGHLAGCPAAILLFEPLFLILVPLLFLQTSLLVRSLQPVRSPFDIWCGSLVCLSCGWLHCSDFPPPL